MKTPQLLFIFLLTISTACSSPEKGSQTTTPAKKDTTATDTTPLPEPPPPPKPAAVILHEDAIGGIPLPFPHHHVEPALKKLFSGFEVRWEAVVPENPDQFAHTIYDGEHRAGMVLMRPGDRYTIETIRLQHSDFADAYGVRISDAVSTVREKRNDPLRALITDNDDSYVFVEGSNIGYGISGTLPAEGKARDLKPEDVEAWQVTAIVWANDYRPWTP